MKKLLALLLAGTLMCSLAACNSDTGSTSSDGSGSTDATKTAGEEAAIKVFTYGGDANSETFDPASDLQTKSGIFLEHACGETLWTIGADGEYSYKLATGSEWTGDLELTITLQQGVKFSNGNEFTADDVLYTLEHMVNTDRTASMFTAVNLETTKYTDDVTLVLALNEYDAAFLDTLSNTYILDRETCEADPEFGWFIGTGPYKLAGDGQSDTSGWEESVRYYLVRNDLYRGDAPYYDELICKFYSEESTRYADFQAGTLDAVYLSEATYINNLAKGTVSGAVLVQKQQNSVYGFSLAGGGGSNGSMSDLNIRKAFAHALDVKTMVESMGDGVYTVSDSTLTSSSWAYEYQGVYEYDTEYAAQCLAEAGYSVNNPLTLRLVAESSAFNSSMAEAAQSYLAAIGISLDLSGMGDFGTILPTLISNNLDVGIGGPSNGTGNDPASLLQQMGPASNNGLLRVTDATLSGYFTSAAASRDQTERTALYQQFQNGVFENYLYIPMWIETLNYGVRDTHTSFESALDANNALDPTLLTD